MTPARLELMDIVSPLDKRPKGYSQLRPGQNCIPPQVGIRFRQNSRNYDPVRQRNNGHCSKSPRREPTGLGVVENVSPLRYEKNSIFYGIFPRARLCSSIIKPTILLPMKIAAALQENADEILRMTGLCFFTQSI